MVFALLVGGVCSCSDDDNISPDSSLSVTYANVAGTWQLTSWNGEAVSDDVYFYMILKRPASTTANVSTWREFIMYQNLDSATSRELTGYYYLTTDDDDNAIVEGLYDYGSGLWNNYYYIQDLQSDTMIWVVVGDATDVSVYTRCGEVPEDILNGSRAVE